MATTSVNAAQAAGHPPSSRPMIIAVGLDGADAPSSPFVYHLAGFRNGMPMLRGAGAARALDEAPSGLISILSSAAERKEVGKLLAWLKARSAPTPTPVVCAKLEDGLSRAVASLAGAAQAGAHRVAETRREAARMHAANAEMAYRFEVAQQMLQRRGLLTPWLAFSNEQGLGLNQQVAIGEAEGGVSQVLPVESAGVGGIGLFVAAPGEAQGPVLEVLLTTLEDRGELARWMIPCRDLAAGWNIFKLERIPGGLSRTMELSLSSHGEDGFLPPFLLGPPQALPAFRLKTAQSGQPLTINSLAFQIWQGLAGTNPTFEGTVHTSSQAPRRRGGFVELPIRPCVLSHVEHANPQDASFDFPAVIAPPGEAMVLCHPPSRGMTLGCLPNAVRADAIKVSASVYLGHERSKDVDFAMIVTDDSRRAGEIGAGTAMPEPHEGFSGWSRVVHGDFHRLSAFREPGGERALSIFVATRMSKPGDNGHAWARFKNFSIMIRG